VRPVYPQGLIVPAVALALTLGVSFLVSRRAESSPAALLNRAVNAYHRELAHGNAAAAAEYVVPERGSLVEVQGRFAREWRSRIWRVQEQAVDASGLGAQVTTVVFVDPSRGVVNRVREEWVRAPGGPWRLAGLDGARDE
jgi:hypothetical protein